jgi:hypothetical protein
MEKEERDGDKGQVLYTSSKQVAGAGRREKIARRWVANILGPSVIAPTLTDPSGVGGAGGEARSSMG